MAFFDTNVIHIAREALPSHSSKELVIHEYLDRVIRIVHSRSLNGDYDHRRFQVKNKGIAPYHSLQGVECTHKRFRGLNWMALKDTMWYADQHLSVSGNKTGVYK